MAADFSLTYKDAGVDINAGQALVERIKPMVKRTHRPEVISGLGSFGALCALPKQYRDPILVSSSDGVGTKLRLAMTLQQHDTIGIDLVAMCVNDLLTQGAEPLFFHDYYATGQLDIDIASSVIDGIATGCQQAGCALIGGETAEMPGLYQGKEYDLAGFSVGIVEKQAIIDGSRVNAGDAVIGLASSGPHANGYALIGKILQLGHFDPNNEILAGQPLAHHLLMPTRIYVASVRQLMKQCDLHAIAHITGGGFWENIPRVLPTGLHAIIEQKSWQWPAIFTWLQQQGHMTPYEMYRTFNCGVGMIIVLPAVQVEKALNVLRDLGEKAWRLGKIVASQSEQQVTIAP